MVRRRIVNDRSASPPSHGYLILLLSASSSSSIPNVDCVESSKNNICTSCTIKGWTVTNQKNLTFVSSEIRVLNFIKKNI